MKEGKIRKVKLSWTLGMGTLQNGFHSHCYFQGRVAVLVVEDHCNEQFCTIIRFIHF